MKSRKAKDVEARKKRPTGIGECMKVYGLVDFCILICMQSLNLTIKVEIVQNFIALLGRDTIVLMKPIRLRCKVSRKLFMIEM